jgi:hypothetical protein
MIDKDDAQTKFGIKEKVKSDRINTLIRYRIMISPASSHQERIILSQRKRNSSIPRHLKCHKPIHN